MANMPPEHSEIQNLDQSPVNAVFLLFYHKQSFEKPLFAKRSN